MLLISDSERELVREQFGAGVADRCEVVFNAVDWQRLEPLPPEELPELVRQRIAARYILSVCHQFPHKNVATLLKAFVRVAAEDADVQLYLIGKSSDENEAFIGQSIPAHLRGRIHVLGFVDDRTLGTYYANARMFALPSLYEGCGIPAMEAMAFGIPTLVSRVFALPETTLGQAHYVDDPLSVESWAEQMLAVMGGEKRLPQELIDQVRTTFAPKAIGQAMLGSLARH